MRFMDLDMISYLACLFIDKYNTLLVLWYSISPKFAGIVVGLWYSKSYYL